MLLLHITGPGEESLRRGARVAYAPSMGSPDRQEACDAAIRSHLDPGEHVLAVGTCNDISERGDTGTTGLLAYVVVTDRKVRWAPYADVRCEAALAFADVIAFSEETVGHRYSIALTHPPMKRPRWGPAHRFLTFAWGNAIVTTPLTRTRLGFSRRDAKAAIVLRRGLANLVPSTDA
jgi:hypothetical protein